MSLLERYKQGDVVGVWKEIHSFKDLTKDDMKWNDVVTILKETIKRVKYNLELVLIHFKNNPIYQIEQTALFPVEEDSIQKLKMIVQPFGTIPLSLELFYKVIGPINLIQKGTKLQFEYADPLYIESVNGIIEMLSDGSWEETMSEICDEGKTAYLEISPDYYHKDNVSGGLPYGIELLSQQCIDSRVINTKYGNLYFIEYLRLCFENGGFPNIKEYNSNYEEFINTIKNEFKAF